MELTKEQIIEILESAKLPNLPKLEGDFYNDVTDEYKRKELYSIDEINTKTYFLRLNLGLDYKTIMLIIGEKQNKTIQKYVQRYLEIKFATLIFAQEGDINTDFFNLYEFTDFSKFAKAEIKMEGADSILSNTYTTHEAIVKYNVNKKCYVYIID